MKLSRLAAAVAAFFRQGDSEVTLGELNPSSRLGIEPLEERIAPGTMVVNPPGGGHGTIVDLPDAADKGAEQAAEHSPAIQVSLLRTV